MADVRLCEQCGEVPLHSGQDRFCSRACYADHRWGKPIKTGYSVTRTGYKKIEFGEHRGRREHIVVAEQMLGRPLLPSEIVHHKNHNRADNRPENIEVRDRHEHAREHGKNNAKVAPRDSAGRWAPKPGRWEPGPDGKIPVYDPATLPVMNTVADEFRRGISGR